MLPPHPARPVIRGNDTRVFLSVPPPPHGSFVPFVSLRPRSVATIPSSSRRRRRRLHGPRNRLVVPVHRYTRWNSRHVLFRPHATTVSTGATFPWNGGAAFGSLSFCAAAHRRRARGKRAKSSSGHQQTCAGSVPPPKVFSTATRARFTSLWVFLR